MTVDTTLWLVELKFPHVVEYLDHQGALIRSAQDELSLPHWVVENPNGRLRVHDGKSGRETQSASEIAFATITSFGFMSVQPSSVPAFLGRANKALKAFRSALGFDPRYSRVGVRCLHAKGVNAEFGAVRDALTDAFLAKSAPVANLVDVAWVFDSEVGLYKTHLQLGPTSAEELRGVHFRDSAGAISEFPENAIFVDSDFGRTEEIPHSLDHVLRIVREAATENETRVSSLTKQLCASLRPPVRS